MPKPVYPEISALYHCRNSTSPPPEGKISHLCSICLPVTNSSRSLHSVHLMAASKAKIVTELAGRSLLLPDLVAAALAANGRIKFALSWLQTAEVTANGQELDSSSRPRDRFPDWPMIRFMRRPNQSCTRRRLFVPGSGKIFERLLEDVSCMRNAVETGRSQRIWIQRRSSSFVSANRHSAMFARHR